MGTQSLTWSWSNWRPGSGSGRNFLPGQIELGCSDNYHTDSPTVHGTSLATCQAIFASYNTLELLNFHGRSIAPFFPRLESKACQEHPTNPISYSDARVLQISPSKCSFRGRHWHTGNNATWKKTANDRCPNKEGHQKLLATIAQPLGYDITWLMGPFLNWTGSKR